MIKKMRSIKKASIDNSTEICYYPPYGTTCSAMIIIADSSVEERFDIALFDKKDEYELSQYRYILYEGNYFNKLRNFIMGEAIVNKYVNLKFIIISGDNEPRIKEIIRSAMEGKDIYVKYDIFTLDFDDYRPTIAGTEVGSLLDLYKCLYKDSLTRKELKVPEIIYESIRLIFFLVDQHEKNEGSAIDSNVDFFELLSVSGAIPNAFKCFTVAYYANEIISQISDINGSKYIVEDRLTGSTTRLLKLQDKTGLPLLVSNYMAVQNILRKSNHIRNMYTTKDVLDRLARGVESTERVEVLVDDANYLFEELLRLAGFEVKKAVFKNDKIWWFGSGYDEK